MARSDTQIKAPKFVMLAAVCIICAALYFAQSVLVPLAVAVLLSWGVALQVKDFAAQLPRYEGNIVEKIRTVRGTHVDGFSNAAKAIADMQKAVSVTTAPSTQPAVAAPIGTTPNQPMWVRTAEDSPGALDA